MNIWKILEIEETKDKEALKKAYRKKLVSVNPEDDPEGFMALRSAYEEALKLADAEALDETYENDTVLTKEIRRIYDNFELRIDTDIWRELFNRDEFVSLDSEENSFEELMRFLMEHVFIPKNVWALIVEQFEIVSRKRELSEHYPDNFLSYMINNAEYDDIIDYDLFYGDLKDVDEYIQQYYELDRALRQNQFEDADKLIHELEDFSSMNPYLEFAKLKFGTRSLSAKFEEEVRKLPEDRIEQVTLKEIFPEQLSELYEDAKALLVDMPEDINLLHMCGDLAIAMDEIDQAKEYYDTTLRLYPDNYFVKAKQAEFAYVNEQYKEARDQYLDLLKENHYDNNIRIGMIKSNQKLIEYHYNILKDDPDNIESKMEIAWSYYQSYQFNEGIEILNSFEPNEEKKHEYVNVKGRTYLCLSEYEKALEHFMLWKQYIEELPKDDDSEEVTKKRKRYEYVNFLIADCYLKLERYDEVSAYLDRALAKEHDEIILSYEAKCEFEYKRGNYEACIKACDELQDRDDKDYIAYDYRSKAFYEMNYLKESFDACQRAIALYPYVADPYRLEIKIFIKIGQIDNAKDVIKRFEQFGIHSDKIELCRAKIYELEDDLDQAIQTLQICIENTSKEETDLEQFEELYRFLGHCYDRKKDYQTAIDVYKKAIQFNPNHQYLYGDIAENYKSLIQYDKAIVYYSKQLEIYEEPYFYLQRGIIHRFLENFQSALSDFENVLRLDPKNFYAHSRIGLIKEYHRRFEEALDSYNQALSLIEKDNEKPYREVLGFKARCLQCMKRFDESYEVYQEYINNLSLNPDIAYDFSELLLRMGKYQEAVSLLRKVIDESEYDADVQSLIRQLIDVYGHAGYVDLAHETMKLAHEKNPNDIFAYVYMADILRYKDDYDKALKLYEEAAKLDKDNRENYHSNILECLNHKLIKQPGVVAEHMKFAEEIKNQLRSPRQYIKYARFLRCKKDYKQAVDTIKKAIEMKRCVHCFYGRCHEAMFEAAMIYIALKDYEMADFYLKEAINVCGRNNYYEEYLAKLQKKTR